MTVAANTSYTYTVAARDDAGNQSLPSSAASVTTPASVPWTWGEHRCGRCTGLARHQRRFLHRARLRRRHLEHGRRVRSRVSHARRRRRNERAGEQHHQHEPLDQGRRDAARVAECELALRTRVRHSGPGRCIPLPHHDRRQRRAGQQRRRHDQGAVLGSRETRRRDRARLHFARRHHLDAAQQRHSQQSGQHRLCRPGANEPRGRHARDRGLQRSGRRCTRHDDGYDRALCAAEHASDGCVQHEHYGFLERIDRHRRLGPRWLSHLPQRRHDGARDGDGDFLQRYQPDAGHVVQLHGPSIRRRQQSVGPVECGERDDAGNTTASRIRTGHAPGEQHLPRLGSSDGRQHDQRVALHEPVVQLVGRNGAAAERQHALVRRRAGRHRQALRGRESDDDDRVHQPHVAHHFRRRDGPARHGLPSRRSRRTSASSSRTRSGSARSWCRASPRSSATTTA